MLHAGPVYIEPSFKFNEFFFNVEWISSIKQKVTVTVRFLIFFWRVPMVTYLFSVFAVACSPVMEVALGP
jgi:hypothetical protein